MAINLFDSPLFKPPFVYILILVIVGIVIIILYSKFRNRKKGIEHFKGETIEEVIKSQNFDKYFNVFGRKTHKGSLYWNNGRVKINRIVKFNTIIDIPYSLTDNKDGKGKIVSAKVNFRPTEYSYICFEQYKFSMRIPIISHFVKPEYFVMEDKTMHIKKDAYEDNWIISDNIHLHLYAGVWIGSHGAANLLTEMIFKRTYEHDREVEMNTPKRFVWYNDIYASKMTSAILTADIEKEKFESKMKSESGG